MPNSFLSVSGSFTDQYELTMAENYFLSGRRDETAVFDYFFRKLPENSGYCLFSGLQDFLEVLQNYSFCSKDLKFLKTKNFHPDFLNYLEKFKFQGKVYACQEGEVVFPYEPVIRVEGTLIETQLIETLLLNFINFQSLIATKASRIRKTAGKRKLLEFGLRRAQGPGGYHASRASIIGGFDGTSNVLAGRDFDIPISGTMAHSFIQSERDELTAFRKFADHSPHNAVLLVDTYNTLESGLPHAIMVAKEMERKGHKLQGIRLDSGDLAYLAKECRKHLDENGLQYVSIVVSSQLDEFIIESLLNQNAPVDAFGVGTRLVTGHPDGALDGVYKLSMINNSPRMKLSDNIKKMNFPGRKEIYRLLDDEGKFLGADIISLEEESSLHYMHDPFDIFPVFTTGSFKKEQLLKLVMKEGKLLSSPPAITTIKEYSQYRLSLLPERFKTLKNPDMYLIGLSDNLKEERDKLISQFKGEPYESSYHH